MKKPIHFKLYVDFNESPAKVEGFFTSDPKQVKMVLQSLFPQQQTSPQLNPNKNKVRNIGWLLSKEKLYTFYEILTNNALVECTYELFESHFLNSEKLQDKIKWYGQANELTYMIALELINRNIIPPPKSMYRMICEHFCKSTGEEFDAEKLRKNQFKGIANTIRLKSINTLVKLIKDIK